MKIIIFLIVTLTTQLQAKEFIVQQGTAVIDFDIVDGYSLTIPENLRAGFFESPQRLDSTIKTILLMKIIVNYALEHNLIDKKLIKNEVMEFSNLIILENIGSNIIEQENNLRKIEEYYFIEKSYKAVQKNIRSQINKNTLLPLAKEHYMISKQSYFVKEKRDIDYINIVFNENNKQQQHEKALMYKEKLKHNNFDINEFEKTYQSEGSDIEIVKNLDGYINNSKYPLFSEFVFKPNTIGLIDKLLENNSRFSIVNIKKIHKQGFKSFDEVKEEILISLIDSKAERDFGELVTRLTKDNEVVVNEDNLFSLKTRYN